jgi:hypothetical protein
VLLWVTYAEAAFVSEDARHARLARVVKVDEQSNVASAEAVAYFQAQFADDAMAPAAATGVGGPCAVNGHAVVEQSAGDAAGLASAVEPVRDVDSAALSGLVCFVAGGEGDAAGAGAEDDLGIVYDEQAVKCGENGREFGEDRLVAD